MFFSIYFVADNISCSFILVRVCELVDTNLPLGAQVSLKGHHKSCVRSKNGWVDVTGKSVLLLIIYKLLEDI